MSRFLSAALTLSLLPMFWWSVAPGAPELCASNVPFAVLSEDEPHLQAAGVAKEQLCRIVEAFPR